MSYLYKTRNFFFNNYIEPGVMHFLIPNNNVILIKFLPKYDLSF